MNSGYPHGTETVAKEALLQSAALQALLRLKDSSNATDSLHEALHLFCKAIEADACCVYKTGTGKSLSHPLSLYYGLAREANAWVALPPGFARQERMLGQEDARQLAAGECIFEQGRTERFHALFPASAAGFTMLLPILVDGGFWGLLGFSSSGRLPYDALQRPGTGPALAMGLGNFLARVKALGPTHESEAMNKAILNALPDLKFRLNLQGFFLDFFGAEEENGKLLMPADQFLGRNVAEVMPDYLSKAILKNLVAAIQNREVHSFEYPLYIGQELRYFEARISAISEEEAIAVIRDITELKHIQQELQNKLLELDRKNQKLEKYVDSNFQLENFAHTVSHDLREPVRTINSFSQLLLQKYSGQLDEDANIYLDFIASNASNMHALIEDLLEYSRFNTSEHASEIIDLEALLQTVINSLHGLIVDNQASIEARTALPMIHGNRTKISQLFQNLISNAIKFRNPGVPPLVQISVEDKHEEWLFKISDNGIGIDMEFHNQIFLLFRRLHSKKYYPGSGIGLALCKRIVEQLGGRIWVESQSGKGASFFFTLPQM
ncbi:MAG: PAS domain-containing protein [Phaeodactylibacter sp.]|nr:PAS domain-containing protein [Phaeodactylibacter sp.]MCB9276365.1 PAS domain-containing protein [Lewinellaceae bacterium]